MPMGEHSGFSQLLGGSGALGLSPPLLPHLGKQQGIPGLSLGFPCDNPLQPALPSQQVEHVWTSGEESVMKASSRYAVRHHRHLRHGLGLPLITQLSRVRSGVVYP